MIKEMAIGFCLGTANIIPGVSGGTFLLIFNLYERVFNFFNALSRALIVNLLLKITGIIKHPCDKSQIKNLIHFLRQNDFLFLLKIITGAAIAIVSLSALMKYLLVFHFSYTYSLFFGLIFISIIIPVRLIKRKNPILLLFILSGATLTILLSCSVNPYTKALKKSDLYEKQYIERLNANLTQDMKPKIQDSRFLSFSGKYSSVEYLYISLCGAVSISAMVLPGISGSLVLILMGEYYAVIEAISGLKTLSIDNILFLSAFSIGMAVGILLFSRVISFVFKSYYDMTIAFLIGLMAGSLYALWPFKKAFIIAKQYVKTNGTISIIDNASVFSNLNTWPQTLHQLVYSLLFFSAGCIIMYAFIKKDLSIEKSSLKSR